MKRAFQRFLDPAGAGFLLLFLFGAVSAAAAEAPDNGFVSRTSKVEGVELHYLTGGKGPTMPVLAIGGEKANGAALGEQAKLVASDATVVVLKNTGHWVLEENPGETTDALMKFLEGESR